MTPMCTWLNCVTTEIDHACVAPLLAVVVRRGRRCNVLGVRAADLPHVVEVPRCPIFRLQFLEEQVSLDVERSHKQIGEFNIGRLFRRGCRVCHARDPRLDVHR